MNILLIGLRASGKSTVGERVAALLGRPFVELDAQVLDRFEEPTVEAVWAGPGEPAWRAAEAAALAACLDREDQIVALGGGTPMIDVARRRIEAERSAGRAAVVYLHCDHGALASRLRAAPGDRPSLSGADPAEEITAIARVREPVFRAMADLEIDVTELAPDQVAERVVESLERR